MASKNCARCGLLHPDYAARCQCGYDFRTGQSDPGRDAAWHEELVVVAAALLFCWPLGIALTWRHPRLRQSSKIIVTCAWFVLFGTALFLRMGASRAGAGAR